MSQPKSYHESFARFLEKPTRDGFRQVPEAFDLPNLKERPHVIDVGAWQEVDRAIVGDI